MGSGGWRGGRVKQVMLQLQQKKVRSVKFLTIFVLPFSAYQQYPKWFHSANQIIRKKKKKNQRKRLRL